MAATEIKVQMQQRRDTASDWTSANPTLLAGELGYETDTGYAKLGDGSTAWNSLGYLSARGTLATDGSAAAPSISFANDTDTGIYRSFGDQIGFSTNGTERFKIGNSEIVINDASNNVDFRVASDGQANMLFVDGGNNRVGVNTDAPSATFHCAGRARVGAASAADAELQIGYGATGNRNAFIDFVGDTTYTDFGLRVIRVDGGENAISQIEHRGTGGLEIKAREAAPIVFKTSNSEKVRITSDGKLGVGTSSPESNRRLTVDIGTTSANVAVFKSQDTGGGSYIGFMDKDTTNGNRVRVGAINDDMAFITAGSEVARLDSSGNLGLGTSSPLSRLHISSSADRLLLLESSDANAYIAFQDSDSSSNTANRVGTVSDGLYFNTGGGGERVRIDSSGDVGVGTTSPSAKLHIAGTTRVGANDTSNATLEIGAGATGNRNAILDLVGDTTYTDYGLRVIRTPGANASSLIEHRGTGPLGIKTKESAALAFSTENTERFRVTSAGKVLLGFTSARANFFNGSDSPKLQLESTTFVDSAISCVRNSDSAAAGGLVLGKTRGTSVGSNTVVESGDSLGQVSFQGADGSEMVEGAKISAVVDTTPGANDMPCRLAFAVTSDGNSTTTERLRINSGGRTNLFASSETLRVRTALATDSTTVAIRLQAAATDMSTGGNTRYQVLANGNVQNASNSYGAISDQKLKENIVNANSQWDDLKAIQVRNYNFIEGQTHTQIGVVAQEVETVSPGLVSESPDIDDEGNDLGTVTKSVNYSVLYMKAVKALQEAMDRIETLEAKVAALEAQ